MDQSTEDDVFGLVLKAKEGDAESLRKLLSHPELLSRAEAISRRIAARNSKSGYTDAEDLRQDTLILIWKNVRNFRGKNGEASFWKYVNTIARNIHVSQIRKSEEETKQSEEKNIDELHIASRENIHVSLSINAAIECLTARQQAILKLKLEDKTLEEIADEVPFDICKSTVHREVEEIQRIFAEHVEGYKKDKKVKTGRKRKPSPGKSE